MKARSFQVRGTSWYVTRRGCPDVPCQRGPVSRASPIGRAAGLESEPPVMNRLDSYQARPLLVAPQQERQAAGQQREAAPPAGPMPASPQSKPCASATATPPRAHALHRVAVVWGQEGAGRCEAFIGLISADGGVQGLQAINTMEFATRDSGLGRFLCWAGCDRGARLRRYRPCPGRECRGAATDAGL